MIVRHSTLVKKEVEFGSNIFFFSFLIIFFFIIDILCGVWKNNKRVIKNML